eukprot:CAMPEP_0169160344 /NCGR_PEP_ID=MMETSP1015-20121227/56400_1 /TAXON_ID=342587 /ORGANISM="Karlodinium micrum, Strain CCMP2283" /LENGTH=34 /DNA_ID= /DNA_START= /DNA_END= /DNA_ORIENTATION=
MPMPDEDTGGGLQAELGKGTVRPEVANRSTGDWH